MTFHQIFYNNYKGYISFDFKRALHLTIADLEHIQKWYPYRITGIGGHGLDFESLSGFRPDTFLFTVLRDPIDRYLSFYHHLKANHELAISLDDFLNYPVHFNFQTNAISPSGSVEEAKQVIDRFDLVGIFEQMDKTHQLLEGLLNIDCNQRKLNQTNQRRVYLHELTREQQQKCHDNNAKDMALYQHALKKFKQLNPQDTTVRRTSSISRTLAQIKRKLSILYVNKVLLRRYQ